MSVDLAWHPWTADVAEALASHVRGRLGEGDVLTGRLCPRCGSSEHGRPWARHEGRPVPVSVSRSRPHLLTAVGAPGAVAAVGADLESVTAVDGRWDPALVLAPGERAADAEERARVWARKEAVLKAYAVGLARPMQELVLAEFPGEVADVPAPPGHVAAVATLAGWPSSADTLRTARLRAAAIRAAAGAPSGTASRRTAPSATSPSPAGSAPRSPRS